MVTHNKYNSKEYKVWWRIVQSTSHKNYANYKATNKRGITLCDEWMDFVRFYKDMGDAPKNLNTIKLKEGAKVYCKKNCVWAYAARGRPFKTGSKDQLLKRIFIHVDNKTFDKLEKLAKEREKNTGIPVYKKDIVQGMIQRCLNMDTDYDFIGNPRLKKLINI